MSNYVIYTDSACDVASEQLKSWGVHSSNLTFQFDGEGKEYSNEDMSVPEFYKKMRDGYVAKTSAVNVATFLDAFDKLLNQGQDILYLGFASPLSATYSSAVIASEQLRQKYPERKILTVDTLCASSGQALLIYHTVKKKHCGASIEEAAAFAEELKQYVCHWITVDDLVYLKRGGRISPTTALVGKALGIKPLIYINAEGTLDSVGKVRGRKKAIAALADAYGKNARNLDGSVFITHSECPEDAKELSSILKERYNASTQLITDIGPVVGAHVGPGGLVFSFIGKER